MTPDPNELKAIALQDRLYRYALRYRQQAESSGRGSEFPSIRQCAKALRATQGAIHDAAEDLRDSLGVIDIIIARGCNGGFWEYDRIGNYEIEAWPKDTEPTPLESLGRPMTA